MVHQKAPHQLSAGGFTERVPIRFRGAEFSAFERTGLPLSDAVERALGSYYADVLRAPWPVEPRATGPGVRTGSTVSLLLFTPEQKAALDRVTQGEKGALPRLIRNALTYAAPRAWGFQWPESAAKESARAQ